VAYGRDGAFVDGHEPRQIKWRIRRKRGWHIGAHAFTTRTCFNEGAQPLTMFFGHFANL